MDYTTALPTTLPVFILKNKTLGKSYKLINLQVGRLELE